MKIRILTLVMTDILEIESRILYHIPISVTRCPTGRRNITNNFFASNRISRTLFNKAKNGASGKAATKIVTNPYCNTKMEIFLNSRIKRNFIKVILTNL